MAKKQKTFFLPDDLCEVVQAYADKQGTSFTKLVTAALLDYLAAPIIGVHTGTMAVAVELEKGKSNVAQALLKVLKNQSAGINAAKISGHPEKGMTTKEAALNYLKHAYDVSIDELHTAVASELDAPKAVIAVLLKTPSAEEFTQAAIVRWLEKGIT